ncbi:MAG: LysR family transcriptional regulator [Beijerinckiaceae bacterium]|nr:LysR family transcriptional regulator [Beijerinckiaceae bacterium]MCI0735127.1 LysR family transcriptional regulator [Beijerinckiaceae bacterium]
MLNEIDLSRADLNLLVLFQAVDEERHVGRAAERLNLSPSAVSHGLRRLRRLLKDPLFLRTPKGVVPTARAKELAEPVAEILARMRSVIGSSEPFNAASSSRRFAIGAPDGISAVVLPPLLATLRRFAPGIDIGIRQLLPSQAGRAAGRAWESALAELEARAIDIAIVPVGSVPARFAELTLYEEEFVITARAGHPFASAPTLDRFCEMRHIVVSLTGDAHGFVDEALAKLGLSRRTALTVPNFMLALAVIGETELIAALPGSIVARHAKRFGLVSRKAPLPLPRYQIRAVAPKAAMMDAGVAWLFKTLQGALQIKPDGRRRRASAPANRVSN